jgi:hypothetical protein
MKRVLQKHLTVFEIKKRFKAKWRNLLTQIDTFPCPKKIQISLCTMTVSMEAPRSEQAGFKFQKPLDFLAHPV